MRVRKYLEFAHLDKRDRLSQEESAVLENLSRGLQEKVLFETYGSIVNSIPSFVANFSRQTVNKAAGILQLMHLTPNEEIADLEVNSVLLPRLPMSNKISFSSQRAIQYPQFI
jgi:hypothetical protein